jgi:hypothetical protein
VTWTAPQIFRLEPSPVHIPPRGPHLRLRPRSVPARGPNRHPAWLYHPCTAVPPGDQLGWPGQPFLLRGAWRLAFVSLVYSSSRMAAAGGGHPGGYLPPGPVLGGFGGGGLEAAGNHKVALLLHFLLAEGHITQDVAVRASGR